MSRTRPEVGPWCQCRSERSRLNQAISVLDGPGFGPDSTSGSSAEERAYERPEGPHAECRDKNWDASINPVLEQSCYYLLTFRQQLRLTA
jgi:hypothetical protein